MPERAELSIQWVTDQAKYNALTDPEKKDYKSHAKDEIEYYVDVATTKDHDWHDLAAPGFDPTESWIRNKIQELLDAYNLASDAKYSELTIDDKPYPTAVCYRYVGGDRICYHCYRLYLDDQFWVVSKEYSSVAWVVSDIFIEFGYGNFAH